MKTEGNQAGFEIERDGLAPSLPLGSLCLEHERQSNSVPDYVRTGLDRNGSGGRQELPSADDISDQGDRLSLNGGHHGFQPGEGGGGRRWSRSWGFSRIQLYR